MNRTYRVWYILVLLVALAPPAVRLLQWQQTHSEPVDPAMASAGATLFNRDWKTNDPMCPAGDGLGPVYNATSCATCHKQGGVGGAGGVEHNVTNFTVKLPGQKPREGVIHAMAVGKPETLQDIHPQLPAITRPTLEQIVLTPGQEGRHLNLPAGVTISQRNTPAVFGTKLIDDIPERVILANAKAQRMKWGMAPPDDENVPVGRALRLANGRVGRFGWKAQMSNLSDFVQAACANELGLGNPGQAQPTPLYMQASLSLSPRPAGYDLTTKQCDQLTAFCGAAQAGQEAAAGGHRGAGGGGQQTLQQGRLRRMPHPEPRQRGRDLQRPAAAPDGPRPGRWWLVRRAAGAPDPGHAGRRPVAQRMANAALVGRGRLGAVHA